ncbi:hypothetical protein [Stakelama marina]|uniref:Uncharacterized protein n=1 Tax=Stakelama marina TaxID=2826939 RepID=A0A8T4ID55_9SPHN|nr:hypothetical protein [Stakelama marina]MBR0551794.1 hypothetical protein [Stakelama marina]
MDEIPSRPSLAQTFAKALQISAKKRGYRAFIPVRMILTLAVGIGVSRFVPDTAWRSDNLGAMATLYGGILAFNALLLAVGWNAFSRIYDAISEEEFSEFLKRYNMFDLHIMFISLVHITLASAAIMSFAGLISLLLPIGAEISKWILAIILFLSVYSLTEAMRATTMMNDLVWDKAHATKGSGNVHNLNQKN